jgi:hypothetical protein
LKAIVVGEPSTVASSQSALSPTSAAWALIVTPVASPSPPTSTLMMFAESRAKKLARRVPARKSSRLRVARAVQASLRGTTGS